MAWPQRECILTGMILDLTPARQDATETATAFHSDRLGVIDVPIKDKQIVSLPIL